MTIKTAIYARTQKHTPENGKYMFYEENIDDIPADQVKDRFMQMMNYLSDARTHDNW